MPRCSGWVAKRHLELTSLRTEAVCRLHAVLATLQPGGMQRRLSAKKAAAMLRRMRPATPVAHQRKLMARDHLADIRRIDGEIVANKAPIKTAVAASLVEIRGIGAIVAVFVIGYTGDPTRFPTADHYAAYNGTAPVEASSGGRTRHRLSMRGNRRIDHALLHMAAVSQIPLPMSGTHLLRQETRRRQNQEGGATGVEATHLRRRLPPAPNRPPTGRGVGPGGHPGTSP